MKIKWSPEAATDFAGIVAYIHEQNPSAADRVAHTMYDSAASLESFPNRGRLGRVGGTRELVLAPLPFIVVYRVKRNVVEIARVLHPDTSSLSAKGAGVLRLRRGFHVVKSLLRSG
jgi:toxin ParE1/3/4